MGTKRTTKISSPLISIHFPLPHQPSVPRLVGQRHPHYPSCSTQQPVGVCHRHRVSRKTSRAPLTSQIANGDVGLVWWCALVASRPRRNNLTGHSRHRLKRSSVYTPIPYATFFLSFGDILSSARIPPPFPSSPENLCDASNTGRRKPGTPLTTRHAL